MAAGPGEICRGVGEEWRACVWEAGGVEGGVRYVRYGTGEYEDAGADVAKSAADTVHFG
jgi:hypothetical protein